MQKLPKSTSKRHDMTPIIHNLYDFMSRRTTYRCLLDGPASVSPWAARFTGTLSARSIINFRYFDLRLTDFMKVINILRIVQCQILDIFNLNKILKA